MDQMDPLRVTGVPVKLGCTITIHQVKTGQACLAGLDLGLQL